MPINVHTYDAAAYFSSPDAQAELLRDAIKMGNNHYLARAIGVISRAQRTSVETTSKRSEALLRAELLTCRDQFQIYGDLHMAKNPPQIDKADANYTRVAAINATLLAAAGATAEDADDVARSPDAVDER